MATAKFKIGQVITARRPWIVYERETSQDPSWGSVLGGATHRLWVGAPLKVVRVKHGGKRLLLREIATGFLGWFYAEFL